MSLEWPLLDNEIDSEAAEIKRWARAGVEPTTTELLADPIALLLMRADRLDSSEVAALIREQRKRRRTIQ